MSETSRDGSVRITSREVYDLVVEVRDVVLGLAQRDKESDKIHEDFEQRLRRVEGIIAKLLGVVAFVMFLAGAGGYWVLSNFVHVHG